MRGTRTLPGATAAPSAPSPPRPAMMAGTVVHGQKKGGASRSNTLPGAQGIAATAPMTVAAPPPAAVAARPPAPLASLQRTPKQAATPHVDWSGVQVDLSVILGTVGRPQLLRECIEAVRASLRGSGLGYEIVVAYGSEAEPALSWLRRQEDVVPVLGGMEGAIPAFNRAYAASKGLLVCQINDDVTVDGDSIARAARHLAANPEAGAVVFQFRKGGVLAYKHEYLAEGKLHPNQMVVRRSVCEQVIARIGDFWGDAAHRSDKTYGGDSAFGVLCHHLGIRLDSVPGVTCRDREVNDALRATNRPGSDHGDRWRAMYHPLLASRAAPPAPDLGRVARVQALDPREGHFPARVTPRRERVLHLHLATPDDPQAGLVRALRSLGDYVQIDWQAAGQGLPAAVLEAANWIRPTLVFMQLQTPGAVSPDLVARLRPLLAPGGVVVTWCGDVAGRNSPWDVGWQVALGQAVDLTMHSSLTHVRALRAVGVNSAYLQIGYDPQQYHPVPGAIPVHDVCFLGNRYYSAEYLKSMRQHDAGLRDAVIGAMSKAFGSRFGLYGSGHKGGQGAIPLAQAHEAYHRAKIGLNVSLCNFFDAYSSDRIFRILGCGTLLLAKRFPLASVFGLSHSENCLIWDTPAEAVELARGILAPGREADRARIAAAGAELARQHHTWEARMGELAALLAAVRGR